MLKFLGAYALAKLLGFGFITALLIYIRMHSTADAEDGERPRVYRPGSSVKMSGGNSTPIASFSTS
jgi:hypothetical protein